VHLPNNDPSKEKVRLHYTQSADKLNEATPTLRPASLDKPVKVSLHSKDNKDQSIVSNKEAIQYSIATNKPIKGKTIYATEEISKPKEELIPNQAMELNNDAHIANEKTMFLQKDAMGIPLLPILESKCVSTSFETINKEISCPTFKSEKRMHFFLENGLAIGFHHRSFVINENRKLATLRKQTESEWYNWGLFLRGGVYISPSLSIGTGFEYVQLKDRFNHTESIVTKLVITYDAITGKALDTALVKTAKVNKGENRYSLINIPLTLRYEKYMQSWKVGIDGGLILNLQFANSGKMYNESLAVEKFKNNSNVFKNSIGIGYQASLFLSKRINVGTDLFIRPTFTTFGKSWSIGGYDPATAYTVYRCEIGVKWVM
jgi:hypothetical protein